MRLNEYQNSISNLAKLEDVRSGKSVSLTFKTVGLTLIKSADFRLSKSAHLRFGKSEDLRFDEFEADIGQNMILSHLFDW